MKLREMSLEQVLSGLELVQSGYERVLYGNDEERTKYIKNITHDMYVALVNFDLKKLDLDLYESETYDEFRAGQIIKDYIIPKMNKAKERYIQYGF